MVVWANSCDTGISFLIKVRLLRDDDPNCSYCEGARDMVPTDECNRYASLRRGIWGKPYLYLNDFQHAIVGDLVSFIGKSRRFQQIKAPSSS